MREGREGWWWSEVEGALPVRGLFPRGALEGVVAAGEELHGTLAKLHRLFLGHDLEAGDGGEAAAFRACALTRHYLCSLL